MNYGHILVVDDEENLLDLLAEYIKNEISEVAVVETLSNPIAALEKIRSGVEYDVIISDIKMPQLDGVQFMQEALKVDPELTFMFMSGFPDRNSISQALKLGAYDFLEKPFTLEQFGHAIKRAIELKTYKGRLHELLELIVFEYMDDLPYDKFIKLDKAEKINILDRLLTVLKMKHSTLVQNNKQAKDKKDL